ncbi:cytochrome c oxidase assembly protein [Actinokineospora globicatena]|uniref:cytochrome c oxidase assembly protein n=1 Tax=Actinokineospora globicatena TaxID=103729 RepID=UPI0020A5B97A|nr:cytochrome c oxidase assembly protein [Actinokineospora globicatena]MCP2302758.1 putative copper resistance protein D [Actinokineospora globicatena]GLW75552.1 copper resistance protein D [Actinokineospora globicatena]GLW82393.1 copper resistance protein D [Actinokineospora globicatena]
MNERTRLAPLVGIGAVTGAVVAAGIAALAPVPVLGLPNPGAVVRYGLPSVRVLAEVVAVLVVGALLAAAVLIPQRESGRAVRLAGTFAGWWALLAAAMVVLTVADALGQTVTGVFPLLGPAVGRLSVALAWLVVANLAALVWVGVRLQVPPLALLALSLVGVAPVALTGHSSAGGDHDIASDSLMLHVVAMSVWVGGLVALLVLLNRPYAAAAARMYSAVALGCWFTVVVTGVVNASLRLSLGDLDTQYGVLVLAKTAAALLLGFFGYLHRTRTLRLVDAGRPRALLQLGAVEILLMLATIGLAVGLSRTPGPIGERRKLSATEVLIGFPLPEPLSIVRVITDWRFDLVFGTAAVIAAIWYLDRLRRRTDPWPVERTVAWLSGCALLLVATSSGLGKYEPVLFSAHVGVQAIVGLVVPALLARGKPMALIGPVAVWLPRPIVAAQLAAAVPLITYALGLYDAAAGQHWARLVILGASISTGLVLFARVSRGPVLLVAATYAVTGIVLLWRDTALGASFYSRLALDWQNDVLANQTTAAWVVLAVAVALAAYAFLSTRVVRPKVTELAAV